MVGPVSAANSPARRTRSAPETDIQQLEAMARMSRESGLVVHVLVARAPGVVEHARQVATELGVDCSADLRARSVRIRFDPGSLEPARG
jgi:hypothetical protein